MSQHTPGPWRLHSHTNTAVVGSTGFVVAACGGYSNNLVDPIKLNAELEANARLIAAAPDLLAALREIAAIKDEQWGGDWEEIEKARIIAGAAIAKAEGKP